MKHEGTYLGQMSRLFAIADESDRLELAGKVAALLGEAVVEYAAGRSRGIEAVADLEYAARLAKATVINRRVELAREADGIIRHLPPARDGELPLPGGRTALLATTPGSVPIPDADWFISPAAPYEGYLKPRPGPPAHD